MNLNFSIVFFFVLINCFSQNSSADIGGKIFSDKSALIDVIIELKSSKLSKFAISDKKGLYKFSNITAKENDTLFLIVSKPGYKTYYHKIENLKGDNNIYLDSDEPKELNEVIIKSESRIVHTARKSIYKIDSKDFLKNAKAGEVLSTVPNVYFNKIEEKGIVDGVLSAKIFIDGIEAMSNELQNIAAIDIDKVEVISNPSSTLYGSEFLGAIINVITKKRTEEFIKGSLGGTVGAVNDYWSVNPAFTYKKGRFALRSNFRFLNNDNNIDFKTIRNDEEGVFFQDNRNKSKGNQANFNTRAGIKLSEKSNITFTNAFSGYKFKSIANGLSVANDEKVELFTKKGKEINSQWNLASVFSHSLKENTTFFVKGAYSIYKKVDDNIFDYEHQGLKYYDVRSKNKELSIALDLEAENMTFFKKNMSFYSDLKFINRDYTFFDSTYFLNQKVVDASVELDTDWSGKISTEIALTFENTNNSNNVLNQNYNLVLPTFNGIYHFQNTLDAKFSYSRKVLRPDASDLNNSIIVIYPGLAKQGNENLDPELRDYYSLTFSKSIKSDSFSIKFYHESINNAIAEVYRKEGELLIQTLDNAAKYNSSGFNVGVKTKLFKKIMTNINSGFDYNVYEDNSEMAVIEKNSGFTFRGNINLSTKFLQDKISVSFSGRQDGPNYSLLSKRITEPYLDFNISTNLLKDKINISLYGRNLLGKSASGFTDISNNGNFYQKVETTNNSRNLLLILTYNFGKKFSDKIDSQDINNNDVRR
ncbi:outer membrane beta-barrel protein [Flavobacterium sp. FlaQc-52]|jgi:outer membrane receptor protein involved in Fe transport|uniref:TonB-dependent receptor n=1 Tax=Flavobacterium sp. FlaQc-52 TaxID=3374185 RepID=UPI003757549D